MVSHTATGEWQSFEGRMRRRRAERLALRADVAADAGCIEEAREALAEARTLAPTLPELDRIEHKLDRPAPVAYVSPALGLPPEGGSHAEPRSGSHAEFQGGSHAEFQDGSHVSALGSAERPTAVAALGREEADEPLEAPLVASGFSRKSTTATAAAVLALIAGGAAATFFYSGSQTPALEPTQEFRDVVQQVTPPPAGYVAVDRSASPATQPQPVSTTGSLDPVPAMRSTSEPSAASDRTIVPASFTRVEPAPAPAAPPASATASPAPAPALPEIATSPVPPLERVARDAGDTPRPPSIATDTLASTPGAAAAPPEPLVPQDALVRSALDRYAAAYSSLDADAAQRVWPGVNRGALSRAFDGLASQRVSLGSCNIDVAGATAHARCAGSTTWQPKVGSGGSRTDRHTWTFDLARAGSGWQIVNANVQNR
jgi:hypothetical protein